MKICATVPGVHLIEGSRLISGNHYSFLICRYKCVMKSQVRATSMAYCDVITSLWPVDARSRGLPCHILKINLNGNNCDTLAEYAMV